MKLSRFAAAFVLVALIAAVPVWSKTKVDCEWLAGPIEVDGSADDWGEALVFHDSEDLSLGMVNDGDWVYVSIKSTSAEVALPSLMRGLIVRFKPKGADALEVRFPVGVEESGFVQEPGQGSPSQETMGLQIQASLEAGIDVRQESKKYERLEFENDHGIRARVTAVQGEFIYELRVPLGSASGSPYHVAAAPGDQVSLRIRNGGAPASGGGPAGGSVGGSSGGMPSSGGLTGMSGGGGGELSGGGSGYRPPDSLKIDAKVTLATGPGN